MLDFIINILAWIIGAIAIFGAFSFAFFGFSVFMVCLGFKWFEPFAMILMGNDPDDDYGG